MGTRWCLICGGEYIDTVASCPDCDVELVDEQPDVPLADDNESHIAYDLAEWSAESRVMLEQLLESDGLRRAWEGTTLVVPESLESRIDNLVEQVEVTALPTLDPDTERVAYDVSDWTDHMVNDLQALLEKEGVPFEFDADGDVVTLIEHEHQIEELMDTIEFPDALEIDDGADEDDDERGDEDSEPDDDGDGDEGDEGDEAMGQGDAGLEAADVLSDLFVAADRLMHKARDHDGVLSLVAAADQAGQLRVPYGFSPASWKGIISMVDGVRSALEDDGSKDEDIEERAKELRDTLREYV